MIFLAGGIYAQQGPRGINNTQKGFNQCQNIPDLTDAQKEKINNLRTAHLKEMLTFKNQLNEKRAHLKTISTGDNVDENKVYAAIDEIGKLKTEIQKKRFKHRQDVRNVLTDEQKVYFDMHTGRGHGKFRQGRLNHCEGRNYQHNGRYQQGKGQNWK